MLLKYYFSYFIIQYNIDYENIQILLEYYNYCYHNVFEDCNSK